MKWREADTKLLNLAGLEQNKAEPIERHVYMSKFEDLLTRTSNRAGLHWSTPCPTLLSILAFHERETYARRLSLVFRTGYSVTMEAKLDIPLNETSLNIVKKSGDVLCQVLNDKFGCIAMIEGVEVEKNNRKHTQPAKISQEQRGQFTLRSGVKVSVWKADLTVFQADAVVNAANEDLKHYGGLALALSNAGGPHIQKESDDYVKKNGKVNTGEAVVLDAGFLPYKKIIHAVGPDLSKNYLKNDVQRAKPLLENAIKNILKTVEKHRFANVAIPAISSGLFLYPLKECAYTIVSTVKQYYDNSRQHLPQEIFFVNHDEPTVQAMEKACHQIFSPQQHQSYVQVASKNTRAAARNPPPSVQIGNVLLTLMKGKIEEQKADVIVNTASATLNLSVGQISNSILQRAGPEMQNEMSKAIKRSNIISTQSYGLSCKEVYHTFCIEKWKHQLSAKILYDSVSECLWVAATSNHSSIAFPAIGTGNLGFSGEESARIMLDAVTYFAQNCPKSLNVYFVIFPSDDKTFGAFKHVLSLPLYGQQPNFGPGPGPEEDHKSSIAPTPQISLVGPSDESTHEAMRWLNDLMYSHTINIYNNFISHFSEEDHLQLSLLAENGLSIKELLNKGHSYIEINGQTNEDTVAAALEVEAMLCKIQKEIIKEEENELMILSQIQQSPKIKTVDRSSKAFSKRLDGYSNHGLRVIKVEELENRPLQMMFDLKKRQLGCSTSRMIQRIPAQFCKMISHIGFQAECAPPEDQKYGQGIYFARKIKVALELWKDKTEEYLYFVEAEVLTGKSAPGEPGLILPPPVGKDPNVIYDSVDGGPDVSVIFSGYQALPTYIIICRRV